jgi:hypothetical protein
MSLHLFAGLRVRDFQAARPCYERCFQARAATANPTAETALTDDEELLVLPTGSRSLCRKSEGVERVGRTAASCTAGMNETPAVWPAFWEPIGHLGVAL